MSDAEHVCLRRRWHVPQQTDITSPYSKSLSRKASQHSGDAQGGRELRTVTSTTASQSPLHADACRLFSRKQKKTADADAVGGNHPADSSLPVTFQDDERNAANEEEDYVEDANLSEAALFAKLVAAIPPPTALHPEQMPPQQPASPTPPNAPPPPPPSLWPRPYQTK